MSKLISQKRVLVIKDVLRSAYLDALSSRKALPLASCERSYWHGYICALTFVISFIFSVRDVPESHTDSSQEVR